MITAIPNQPISFLPSSLLVDCPDKRLPLIAKDDDILRFQIALDAPAGQYAYQDAVRDWDATFEWGGPGSWVAVVGGGMCAIEAAPGGYIQPISNLFAPVVGAVYIVTIEVMSIAGMCTFTMGGQSFTLSTSGTQSITVTAATTDGPRITLDNSDSRICVGQVMVFVSLSIADGCEITVEIVDAVTDSTLYEFNSTDRPDLFMIAGGIVGVTAALIGVEYLEPGSCVFLRVTYSCNDEEGDSLCSQPISIDNGCKGTILIRACLDNDALGFAAPAIMEVRVKASLVRPRWEHDASEERWSDGTIFRYYIDRQRVMPLLLQPIDEVLHPFMAALCMFDHVYIEGTEYSVDADGYDPDYGDATTGTAGTLLTVRPKRELLRRVSCDAPGPGCDPANDPPCGAPNVFVTYEFDEDAGGYIITVNVYSALGFLPDRVRLYIDGVEAEDIQWTTPSEYLLGPVPAGSTAIVELTNRDEPSCDWSTAIVMPNCPRAYPPVHFAQTDVCDEDPQYFYFDVSIADGLGFIAAGLRITLDGVFYEDQMDGPGDYVVGPFPCGVVVGIVVVDGSDAECDNNLGTFECACAPCDSYPAMPTMVDVDFIATADQRVLYEGIVTTGQSVLIQDLPNATPPGSDLWELNTGNTAIWNGSSWDITTNAPGTVINILSNSASDDFDKWWVVRGAEDGTALYPSGKMALQWLYPTRSNDSDTNPGSRFFDRSLYTDTRADSSNLTDCRKGQVQISADGVTGWSNFGLYDELIGMTTGGSHDLDNIYGRVIWYGGPTGSDLQGISQKRLFPV